MKVISLLLLSLASLSFAVEPVSDGLIIQLKADSITGLSDGQTVSTWSDSAVADSVDGTVASAGYGTPVYVANSINSMPAVRFSRSESDVLVSNNWTMPDPSAGLTVYIVCTGGGSNGSVERAAQIGSANGTASKMIAIDTSTNTIGSGCRYNNGYGLVQGSANPISVGVYHIGVRQMAQNGGHGSLFYAVDDLEAEVVSANNPGNTIVFDASGNHISVGNGASPGGGWYPDNYDGDIAEILVYNKQLSLPEMSQTGKYLSEKYGLAFTTAAIAVVQSGDNTLVTEDGQADVISLSMTTSPGSDPVVVNIYDYLDPDQVVVEPALISFDSSNWQDVVEVTVMAIDDNYLERPIHDTKLRFEVEASQSSPYYGVTISDIDVYIDDNDCGSDGFNSADINLDCKVDMEDFALFALEWFECSSPDPDCQL